MDTLHASGRPQIWTMAVTHQTFRREFELAPRIVRDIGPGERDRQQQAAAWFGVVLAMMHHHHVGEDALMYPLLVGRAPQVLLDRMEDQHRRLATAVDRTTCLAGWRHDEPASAAALAKAFDDMLPMLVEHVDAEEQEIMTLVAEHLTEGEYARLGTNADAADPRALMMSFGSVVEQATEQEATYMLAYPPEHVRRAWYEHGAAEYGVLMQLLRADVTPLARSTPPSDVRSVGDC